MRIFSYKLMMDLFPRYETQAREKHESKGDNIMKRTIKKCRGFRAFLTLLLLVVVNGFAWSATRFCLTYSKALQAAPISGRALLVLSADPAVDPDIPNPFRPFITFGMDFTNWKSGETIIMTEQNSESYMDSIAQLKGKYSLRAVIDTDLQSSILQKQGTLYSDKLIFEVNENGETIVDVRINNIVNGGEFKDTETVQLLKVKSDLLSAFYRESTFIEAAVILPDTYAQNPGKQYPVVFVFPGWGSTHMAVTRDDFQQKRYGMSGYGQEKIFVFLNQDCRFGFHVFADSENNGPRATSFVKEFIPFLEEKYRVARQACGRFLVGQSSGGWAALWLQINFPDVFGMVWAGSPDPVDFRDFVGHDLYDKKANLLYDSQGRLTKATRSEEHPFTKKEWLEMEAVLGDGGQYQSFEAVFGARGREGRPQPLFDRKTGEIDQLALEHWKKYDINLILQKNDGTLREKLAGRIHIVVAGNDPFFLDGSVRLLKDALARLRFNVDIEILESGEHNTWSEDIRKKMHEKMDELYLPQAGKKEKL